jgi:hypothetical protein
VLLELIIQFISTPLYEGAVKSFSSGDPADAFLAGPV